ncbi:MULTISPECIES: alcohol dehydrogenase catalytic domain-containing protein [Bacteria]|uniref:alcohol dehydrogenase catalytic domain-containing protein n=1 Tax=Bacteria TaxID=2 RepID=UPI003C7A767D
MRTMIAPGGEPVHRQDVALRPAAIAMVWTGVGQRHQEMAVPGVALAPDDLLVAVELTTICGDDVRVVQGHRSAPAPLVLGHESVGRVIAVGEAGVPAIDGSALQVGDRIVWAAAVPCGACDRCASGRAQTCRRPAGYGRARVEPRWELTGGFAGHVHLRGRTAVVRVPEAMAAAVLAPVPCATAMAWAAVARGAREHALGGARVVVFGAGLVGLTAAVIAAEDGATVLMVESDPARRTTAARFGLTTAPPDAVADGAADVVIASSGRAVAAALDAADVGAAVVLVGDVVADGAALLDAERVVSRFLTVTGVQGYTEEELAAAVAFMAGRGRAYPFADLVGAIRPLAAVDEALAEAAGPDAPLRIGVAPR